MNGETTKTPMQEALAMTNDELREELNKPTGREETTMSVGQPGQPSEENIYTEQIGQCVNAIDEIGTHVEGIERKAGIILGPAPQQEGKGSLPGVPSTSTTNLSSHLAELASHVARLGEHVIQLEDRIIV